MVYLNKTHFDALREIDHELALFRKNLSHAIRDGFSQVLNTFEGFSLTFCPSNTTRGESLVDSGPDRLQPSYIQSHEGLSSYQIVC